MAVLSTMDSVLPSHPVALGSILGILDNFSHDVAKIYCEHCLEQWLDNVDQVLQKIR